MLPFSARLPLCLVILVESASLYSVPHRQVRNGTGSLKNTRLSLQFASYRNFSHLPKSVLKFSLGTYPIPPGAEGLNENIWKATSQDRSTKLSSTHFSFHSRLKFNMLTKASKRK